MTQSSIVSAVIYHDLLTLNGSLKQAISEFLFQDSTSENCIRRHEEELIDATTNKLPAFLLAVSFPPCSQYLVSGCELKQRGQICRFYLLNFQTFQTPNSHCS
jgi:hypothetical protein